ncbi:hypothetical protein BANRA_05191 [Klebsiella pneumoniae]|nr:hypothetical protein BANRA_05191 [Klebsiella pneumoniae]
MKTAVWVVVYFVLLLLRHLFGGYRHLMTLHDSVAHSSVAIAFANRNVQYLPLPATAIRKVFSLSLFFYVNCSHITPRIHAGMTVWPWFRFCNAAVG